MAELLTFSAAYGRHGCRHGDYQDHSGKSRHSRAGRGGIDCFGRVEFADLVAWTSVSSSHCLIGALTGAGVAANDFNGVSWYECSVSAFGLLISPIIGFIGGALFTFWVLQPFRREDNPGSSKQPQSQDYAVAAYSPVLVSASAMAATTGRKPWVYHCSCWRLISLSLAIRYEVAVLGKWWRQQLAISSGTMTVAGR